MHSSIPPVSRLPTELLLEIFTLLVSPSVSQYGLGVQPEYDDSSTLWTLTHVCCRWRYVLFDDAKFFSTIVIHTDKLETVTEQALEAETEMRLKISQPYGLDICLYQYVFTPVCKNLYAMLIQHSHRWKSLSAYISLPELKELDTHCLFPKLKSLSLRIKTFPLRSVERPLIAFENAPILNSVTIDISPRTPHDFNLGCISLPYGQLDSFFMLYRGAQAFDALKFCPNLRILGLFIDFYGYCFLEEDIAEGASITHDKLSTLAVPTPAYLQCLTLPNLQHLIITTFCFQTKHLWRIPSFLTRSAAHLTELSLPDFIHLHLEQLVECLPLLKDVQSISLIKIGYRNKSDWRHYSNPNRGPHTNAGCILQLRHPSQKIVIFWNSKENLRNLEAFFTYINGDETPSRLESSIIYLEKISEENEVPGPVQTMLSNLSKLGIIVNVSWDSGDLQ